MFTKFGKFPQGKFDFHNLLTFLSSCLHVFLSEGFFVFFFSASTWLHKKMLFFFYDRDDIELFFFNIKRLSLAI